MLDESDAEAVWQVVLTSRVGQGPVVTEFENAVSAVVGTQSGVATSSGTTALHLALAGLEIGPGDEVILPSYVCPSLLHATSYVGATPVLADVDAFSFNLTAEAVAAARTERTRAVVVVHTYGQPAGLDSLKALGIPLIEDCAHAIGATYKGQPVGSFGVLAICSFHATKVFTTGEGGMVLGKSRELLDQIRDLRDYAGQKPFRHRFSYRMSDLQAALGLSQLRKLPDFIARRQVIAAAYTEAWRNLDIELPDIAPERTHIFYRYLIQVQDADHLRQRLRDRGVHAMYGVFKPLHRCLGLDSARYPVTESLCRKGVSIPIYPALSDAEVSYICKVVAEEVTC